MLERGKKGLVHFLVLIRTRLTCSPSLNRHVYLYRKTFQRQRQRLQKTVVTEQICKNRFRSRRSTGTVLSALHKDSICINSTIHYVIPSFPIKLVSRAGLRQQTENLTTIRVSSLLKSQRQKYYVRTCILRLPRRSSPPDHMTSRLREP
jgi:hypothetical protein